MDCETLLFFVLIIILVVCVCMSFSKQTIGVENFVDKELSDALDTAIEKSRIDENTQMQKLNKNLFDVDNTICEENNIYYNIDDSYVNSKENITTTEGKLYVVPKTKKGIYNENVSSCVSPDENYKRSLQCGTLMMSNCVDDFGLISNSPGQNALLGDKDACLFKYCRAFCADIKKCWKYDSNQDVIRHMKYNTNCTDDKFNESKPSDCYENPLEASCPDRNFYNYNSNDLTNTIYENKYDVSRQQIDNETIQCIYKTDNLEKKFTTFDEAAEFCSYPSTSTCHYLSNNIYTQENHRLEKASCSYNSNIDCISDLNDSYCDFTKPYFSLSGSEYVGTQKIDSFDKVDIPTELIEINARQKKCDVSARYIYDNDLIDSLSCEEQVSDCYNLENDVVQSIYGRKDPAANKCIFDNCFSFEASSNANEQRRLENIEIERNNAMASSIIEKVDSIQAMIDSAENNVDEEIYIDI